MMGKSSGKEGGDGMEKMEGGSHDVVHGYSTTTTYDDGEQQQQVMRMNEEEEICWLEREQETLLHDHDHQHHHHDDPSMMFYTDFPPLPAAVDCCFPCMSSSSSSSSSSSNSSRTTMTTSVVSAAAAPAKSYTSSSATSSSSSSAAVSWTVPKQNQQTEGSGGGGGENEKKRRHYDVVLDDDDHHQGDADAAAGDALLSSSTASMTMELFSAAAQPHEDYCSDDIDCINVVENFGCMDLLDNNDIWDPCSIFQFDNNNNNNINIPEEIFQDQKNQDPDQDMSSSQQQQPGEEGEDEEEDEEGNVDQLYFLQGNGELAVIFLEWLKQNREYISAEDMRNIKLKRSTIECASKRLGSSKEGKKQLLKLILEWVEQYQLQRKRLKETSAAPPDDSPSPYPYPYPYPYSYEPPPPPNPDFNSLTQDPNLCFSPSTWLPVSPPAAAPIGGGFIPCDAYSNGLPGPASPSNQIMNGNIYHSLQPEAMDSSSSPGWNAEPAFAMMQPLPPPNRYTFPADNCSGIPNSHQALYGNPNPNPYPYHQVIDGTGVGIGVGVGERLVRLGSSATKEARKKRMARQRRLNIHQYRHSNQNQNQNHHQHQGDQQRQQHGGGSVENCTSNNNNNNNSQPNGNSWVYWSPTSSVPPSSSTMTFVDAPNSHTINNPPDRSHQLQQQQNQHRLQSSSDRRQGYKTEKNLKFLLQKVLKQSDVGNLGRIVLPKKEAETHLPELESRDGIPIAMEDIGTSNVWNMRYRFWPNNKSRMYLLENTGDFVRVNGLQEGDFIVIYSDTKCGKYLIRGVKVRQPGSKSEGKKPVRRNMRNLTQAGGAQTFSQLAPFKQTVT